MPDNLSEILNQVSLVVSALGALAFIFFYIGFVSRVRQQKAGLEKLKAGIAAAKVGGGIIPLETLAAPFAGNLAWSTAWATWEKTLRRETENVNGQDVVKSIHTSVAPETIFSRSSMIDSSYETKNARHMPCAAMVLGSVAFFCAAAGAYLQDDGDGFTSAGPVGAMALALVPMLLGFAASGLQKTLPATLPPLADEVVQDIATLYPSGDAVQAQEQQQQAVAVIETKRAEEAAQMRDMLAKVLGEVLAQQVGRQTMALQSSTANITGDIVKTLGRAMEQPLAQIVQAVQQSSKQAESLEGVLMKATAAMTRDIAQSTKDSAKQAENIERLLKDAVGAMSRDVTVAISKSFEAPLQKMVQVVEQSGRQAENVDKLLQNTMSQMVAKVEAASQEQIRGLNTLMMENAKSLADMRQNIAQMMDDLKKNTEHAASLTNASIEKMDLSAKTILNAAEKFGEAGEVMNSQISHAHSLSRHMMESGMALNGSAQALSQAVADYGKARDSIGNLVTTLQGVVKEVDQKVTINQSLVDDMQKVADRLKEVQAQTDQYLHQVSDVLSTGFTGFGKSVHENLEKSTSAFHTSMSSSVELISVQMRNLTSALQELPELLRKPAA
jgi:hypothetical protein